MKICEFSLFNNFAKKDSWELSSLILWASLKIIPVIISEDNFLDSRSRTNYLYVIENTPPLRKISVLLLRIYAS
jgi:hypothetical protein